MKSCLDEQQIGDARRREQIEEGLLRAIGKQGPNQTQHIDFVWLSPKDVRFDPADAHGFRLEILALVQQTDQRWMAKEHWEQECNEIVNDLGAFPILAKYLNHVDFHPVRRGQRNIRWITFPCRGGAYDPREMRETLRNAFLDSRADKRYEDLARRVGLQEIYLLVPYDFNAFAYNHPFDEPGFGFKEAAVCGSRNGRRRWTLRSSLSLPLLTRPGRSLPNRLTIRTTYPVYSFQVRIGSTDQSYNTGGH